MGDPVRAAIVALIPAFEEGPRIGAVVSGARQHLPVVVVDDGSRDDTAERAAAAGATVVRQVPNAGKGAALRVGFRHAIDAGCDAVVTLDADGQHDPAEIPAFLAVFAASRPELVVGRRDFATMPPVRRLSNTLGGLILSAAVGRSIPDNQSGYRLIGRTLMRTLLSSEESGFEFEVEMIARCIALGLPIEWVPIRTIYAGESSHIQPWRHFTEFLRITRDARRIARGGSAQGRR
ncbi:MAG TPA: glycosyltransferase family 2 protein [Candidatus Limnocylindrales bacterium]